MSCSKLHMQVGTIKSLRGGSRFHCSFLHQVGTIKSLRGGGRFHCSFLHQDGGPLCTSLLCHLESGKEKPGRRSQEGVGGGGWREGVWARGEPFQDT